MTSLNVVVGGGETTRSKGRDCKKKSRETAKKGSNGQGLKLKPGNSGARLARRLLWQPDVSGYGHSPKTDSKGDRRDIHPLSRRKRSRDFHVLTKRRTAKRLPRDRYFVRAVWQKRQTKSTQRDRRRPTPQIPRHLLT